MSRALGQLGPPPRDWAQLRRLFESGALGYRKFAAVHNISPSTLNQRIMREGWKSSVTIVRNARRAVDAQLRKKQQARIERDLAPWIEKEKAKFTRKGHKLATKGLARVERFWRAHPDPDAKNDAMIAKAGEAWHRVGRTALGMNDGMAPIAPLSLAILGSHTAVQINQGGPIAPAPGGNAGDDQAQD